MATVSKHDPGQLSGSIGPLVFCTWKDKPYVRSRPGKRPHSSPAQLAQQARFATAQHFLQPFKALLPTSFQTGAIARTPFMHALSHLLANAIAGTYPRFYIDYAKAVLSYGNLPNPPLATATGCEGGIRWQWSANNLVREAALTDGALLAVYCPALRQAAWQLNAARRLQETGWLLLPDFAGYPVASWLAFISNDGREVSNSLFTGIVTVK